MGEPAPELIKGKSTGHPKQKMAPLIMIGSPKCTALLKEYGLIQKRAKSVYRGKKQIQNKCNTGVTETHKTAGDSSPGKIERLFFAGDSFTLPKTHPTIKIDMEIEQKPTICRGCSDSNHLSIPCMSDETDRCKGLLTKGTRKPISKRNTGVEMVAEPQKMQSKSTYKELYEAISNQTLAS